MSDNKNGLFGNTESDKGAEYAEAEKILETPLEEDSCSGGDATNAADTAKKPTVKKKRTPAADTVLKIELKRLIKQKALGTSGLERLKNQKVILAEQMTKLDAAIATANEVDDPKKLDAKIEAVKADLLEAIIASA